MSKWSKTDTPLGVLARTVETEVVSANEARALVETYYNIQDFRIISGNRAGAGGEDRTPKAMRLIEDEFLAIESVIRLAMLRFAESSDAGRWLLSICGVGPVLAGGLLAHTDIYRCPKAGHLWRFVGYDPSAKWKKATEVAVLVSDAYHGDWLETIAATCKDLGRNSKTILARVQQALGQPIDHASTAQVRTALVKALSRRPWNARAKVLCWKIGESFVKTKGNSESFYGPLYDQRRLYEHERNLGGEYRAIALARLDRGGVGTEQRKYYEKGMLPPGHLHSRAKRWTVKLFLAHWHQVLFEQTFKTPVPLPYVIVHKGHTTVIPAPNYTPLPGNGGTILPPSA